MRKLLFTGVLLATISTPLLANYTVQLSHVPGSSTGGAFLVTGDLGTFYTFCVEPEMQVRHNVSYTATIDSVVMYGGAQDALKENTKKIYSGFLNAGSPLTQQVNWFRAIWDAEEGKDWSYLSTKYSSILANIDTTRWEDVRVMNLWNGQPYDPDCDVQSQLIRVPAPGALLLGSMGMGLVGWLRRRRAL